MSTVKTLIAVVWVVFWVYWLISSAGAKKRVGTRRARPQGLVIVVAFVALRVFNADSVTVQNSIVQAVGVIVFLSGLALAVWARVYLGRNWGMPMTEKKEPELVTSGPYRFVRHPIYTGILFGMLGTALATDVIWVIVFAVTGAYFVYSARVEEGLMARTFPSAYPRYRARTKMLIPFVF